MKNDFVTFNKKDLIITVQQAGRKTLVIKKTDVQITAFSRGAGGQNVNRNLSGVRLIYRIPNAYLLPFRKTKEITSRSIASRNRERNLITAFTQLADKLRNYFYVPPIRTKTKTPKRAKEKRLQNKKRRGQLKSLRKPPKGDL